MICVNRTCVLGVYVGLVENPLQIGESASMMVRENGNLRELSEVGGREGDENGLLMPNFLRKDCGRTGTTEVVDLL